MKFENESDRAAADRQGKLRRRSTMRRRRPAVGCATRRRSTTAASRWTRRAACARWTVSARRSRSTTPPPTPSTRAGPRSSGPSGCRDRRTRTRRCWRAACRGNRHQPRRGADVAGTAGRCRDPARQATAIELRHRTPGATWRWRSSVRTGTQALDAATRACGWCSAKLGRRGSKAQLQLAHWRAEWCARDTRSRARAPAGVRDATPEVREPAERLREPVAAAEADRQAIRLDPGHGPGAVQRRTSSAGPLIGASGAA